MLDLFFYVRVCKAELDALNIKYADHTRFVINSRAKRRWGQCAYKYNGFYEIQIAKKIIDSDDIIALKTTILHELLHSCKGCMNHGDEWQRLANIVNKHYGYKISRLINPNEYNVIDTNKYKYTIMCINPGCVCKVNKSRMCDLIECIDLYRCPKCNTHSLKVIVNY